MKTRLQLILLLFLYSLLSYQFIKNHLYDVNPDGISYIEIAQIYKSGNLREAINAYWGPGYSLALLLLSYFFGWIQTARALTFGLNILWIVGLYVLSLKLLKSEVKAFSVVGLSFLFPTFLEVNHSRFSFDCIFTISSIIFLLHNSVRKPVKEKMVSARFLSRCRIFDQTLFSFICHSFLSSGFPPYIWSQIS